jgi:hypothetical protein
MELKNMSVESVGVFDRLTGGSRFYTEDGGDTFLIAHAMHMMVWVDNFS